MAPVANPKSFCLDIKKSGEAELEAVQVAKDDGKKEDIKKVR